jgi:23S rRNA (cytidine2498-2'-O)-methyltransferase
MPNPENDSLANLQPTQFIFVICQNGAETAAKLEIISAHPNLKLAFSRPGFITFKVDPDDPLPLRFTLRSTLARTYGWSVGKIKGEIAGDLVASISEIPGFSQSNHVHVWQRDPVIPGKNGFEPGISTLAREIGKLFESTDVVAKNQIPVNHLAKPDELVFDVVMVETNEWWYGFHFANTVPGRWPGGVPFVDATVETCSRAYFKVNEALLWSGINIRPGDGCAEIGSSPGGACQFLLERGAHVIGIDPAEMEPVVQDHENFTHVRRRGHEVKKRDFRHVRWLFADLNVDPNFTLDTVSEIVTHDSVDVRGIILTLKLMDWKQVAHIPKLISRVKELGFQVVKSRQLAFNRQEFCLIGVKDKFALRQGKKTQSRKATGPKRTPKKRATEPRSEHPPAGEESPPTTVAE